MSRKARIPAFSLYGEKTPFPDVIHCERFSVRAPENDWRIAPHRHDQMAQLFLVESGRIEATVDGESHHLSDHHYIYIPDSCVHSFTFEPATKGSVLSFPSSVVSSLSPSTPQILGALAAPVSAPLDQRTEQLAALIAETAASSGAFRAQQVVGLAHSILAHLAERHLSRTEAPQNARPAKLLALEELIRSSMEKGWSAADYASALSLSTGHLSRLCRSATGLGAAAFIEQRVMSEACRLLAFTQLPVAEVGYRLGYEDPSYFSKRFRRAQGLPPTLYRRRFTDQDHME
jgi:AraC family transcriptional activator of pobA